MRFLIVLDDAKPFSLVHSSMVLVSPLCVNVLKGFLRDPLKLDNACSTVHPESSRSDKLLGLIPNSLAQSLRH